MADLNASLLIFLLIAVLVFIVARCFGIRIFSSIVLALLVSYFILMTIQPWASVEGLTEGNLSTLLYLLISVIIPIVVLIYVVTRIFSDRERNIHYYELC